MEKAFRFFFMTGLILLFSISVASAANQINVQQTFAGKTAFGKKLIWGMEISVLFKQNGQIIIVDAKGNVSKGSWWVNDEGLLCTNTGKPVCRKVSKLGDRYRVHNHKDEKKIDWLFADLAKGNPYGIK